MSHPSGPKTGRVDRTLTHSLERSKPIHFVSGSTNTVTQLCTSPTKPGRKRSHKHGQWPPSHPHTHTHPTPPHPTHPTHPTHTPHPPPHPPPHTPHTHPTHRTRAACPTARRKAARTTGAGTLRFLATSLSSHPRSPALGGKFGLGDA